MFRQLLLKEIRVNPSSQFDILLTLQVIQFRRVHLGHLKVVTPGPNDIVPEHGT